MCSRRNPLSSAALLILLITVHSTLSLTCRPGEYLIGSECCPLCLAGSRVKTHCTEYRSTSCLPCMDGTFTDKPNGLDRCSPCTSCDSGSGLKVKRACTAVSDAVCEPLQGFYCLDPKGDGCETALRHSSCEPGQFISHNGTASTDTECSHCSAGTFSDGTSPSCQPHTQCEDPNPQLITAGTSAADALCGPRSDNVGAAVGVSVGVILFIIAAAGASFYFREKIVSKLSSLNRNTDHEASQRKPDEEQGLAAKENGRGTQHEELPLSAK